MSTVYDELEVLWTEKGRRVVMVMTVKETWGMNGTMITEMTMKMIYLGNYGK